MQQQASTGKQVTRAIFDDMEEAYDKIRQDGLIRKIKTAEGITYFVFELCIG